MVEEEHGWRRTGTDLLLALVGLGWALGTPVLLYQAVIVATPFFGETPSPAEMHRAGVLLSAGLACGLGLPVLGLVIAGVRRRAAAACLFAAALVLTVGVIGYVASR